MNEIPANDEDGPIRARLVGDQADSPPNIAAGDPPPPPAAPHFDDRPSSFPVDLFERGSAAPQDERDEGATLRVRPPAAAERREGPAPSDLAARERPRRRRIGVPIVLFLLTCLSTFWAGCAPARSDLIFYWLFGGAGDSQYDAAIRLHILTFWQNGLIYMACVLSILFAHEMGHFLMTLRYRIAASLPYFLPVPFTPIGTMGAVISMDGLSADRRQIFDIGIAGPLAGLVLAIPITIYGVSQLDYEYYDASDPRLEQLSNRDRMADDDRLQNGASSAYPGLGYHMPWMISTLIQSMQPDGYTGQDTTALPTSMMNPFLMAGWVGLLITGLNMMPISQLDGGHVIYGLFGKRAHVIARVSLFVAIFFVVVNFDRVYIWTVMLLLVTLMGTDHPPTANDDTPLGVPRTILGWVSLSIPFLCFPFFGLWQLT